MLTLICFEQKLLVTARAFKPLGTFLDILDRSNIKFKKLILLKGENMKMKFWMQRNIVNCELHDSITNKPRKFSINSVKGLVHDKIISVINQKGGVGKLLPQLI